MVMGFLMPLLVGAATGVLSGMGVGGGTLLMVYMTAVAGLPQQAAQRINLVYFNPTSLAALYSHIKNKLVRWDASVPAMVTGLVATGACAWIAAGMETGLLKKIFGVFLIAVGLREIFRK